MIRTEVLTCSFVLLFVAAPVCQAQFSPAYEHLKPLAWQIGDWVTEYKATNTAGPIKQGDTVKTHFSLNWAAQRSAIINRSYDEVNGERVSNSVEIISWNYKDGVVQHAYHGTWGTGQGVWKEVGCKAILLWTINGPFGEFRGRSLVASQGDTWQWQIVDQTKNSEAVSEMPPTTFQREECEPAGDLWKSYAKVAAGQWVGQGNLLRDVPKHGLSEGDPFRLTLIFDERMQDRILAGPQTFQITNDSRLFPAHVVSNWDPATKQIRLAAFWGDGFVEEMVFSRHSKSKFFGTYIAKAPGAPSDRWPISLQFPDDNSYIYKFTAGPYKGEVLSSWRRKEAGQ